MIAVTIDDAWPGFGDAFTVAELDRLPAPELTVFELRDGGYFHVATSTRPLTVAHPFEVAIVPANLTKGLRR